MIGRASQSVQSLNLKGLFVKKQAIDKPLDLNGGQGIAHP
jgi:hypothetical protein